MNHDPLSKLLDDIKYQVFSPESTTFSACECCSIEPSRGGRKCVYCLRINLGNMASYNLADAYIQALFDLKEKQLKYNELKAK
jgi:hypothetical protein